MLQGIDEPLGITRRSFVWRRAVVLPAILLMALSTLSGAWAENRAPDEKRPRIGLVLGGGGARGAAHVGVIKVLERLRVPIDYIVGTSMGAIVGGLYATGMSADELEHALASVDWNDIEKLVPLEWAPCYYGASGPGFAVRAVRAVGSGWRCCMGRTSGFCVGTATAYCQRGPLRA